MADKLFQLRSYFRYWLDAVDEHSLHSPFFFDFYTKVLRPKKDREPHQSFEKLRRKLLLDTRNVEVDDYGSKSQLPKTRKISSVAKTSLSLPKFSALYARIIRHFNLHTIVELGTSLGINTLYLALGKETRVATFEGSAAIASIANITFEFAQARNINIIQGDINNTLSSYLQSVRKLDFVFMDANHQFEPTMRYFELLQSKIHERSVVILDDIYNSEEMAKAWEQIKKHKLVYGSADLFRCGILFFDPSLNKQHVILQF